MFGKLIDCLISRVDLTEAEAQASLDYLLNEADEALISAFLVLLRAKGETFGEVKVFVFDVTVQWGSLYSQLPLQLSN